MEQNMFLDCYTFTARVGLLFNPCGRKQLTPIVNTLPMDNTKKAKHTFREKPGLKPWFIDHAKALPATTGATALKVKMKASQCHLSLEKDCGKQICTRYLLISFLSILHSMMILVHLPWRTYDNDIVLMKAMNNYYSKMLIGCKVTLNM